MAVLKEAYTTHREGVVRHLSKQGLCVPHVPSQPRFSAESLGAFRPQSPVKERSDDITGKDIRISVRVTEKEKQKIQSKARKCGISTTEYVKQRALGYEPKGLVPDALFLLLEKIGDLEDKSTSAELNEKIDKLLKDIASSLLLHEKDG